MNVLEIPELGKRTEYPSCWEECSPPQLLYIFREASRMLAGKISPAEFRIRVFYNLAGIFRTASHNRREGLLTSPHLERKMDNVRRASETVDFILSERGGQLVFEFGCVRNLIPEIRIGRRRYCGPAEALFNISFGEYRVASDYYSRFVRDGRGEDLNVLCSVLYRPYAPGRPPGDPREPFSPHVCLGRAAEFSAAPDELKMYILAWFSACDNYFKTGQLEIDGRLICLAPLFRRTDDAEGGVPDADSGELGLTGILMSVAGSGTFGPVAEVEKTNLYSVLIKLYHWHLEGKRMEKISERHGKS